MSAELRSRLIAALSTTLTILERPTWAASGIDHHVAAIAAARATLDEAQAVANG